MENLLISEQRQAQILAQAKFISRVMDASPDTIHIVNIITGTTVYINKVLLNDLGYSAEEIRMSQLEKKINELYHPDDLDRVNDFKENILKASDEDAIECEARMKARNGTWQWLRTRGKVFERDAAGHPEKYIGFSQNITGLKAFEEEKKNNAVLNDLNRAKTEFFSNVSHEFKTPLALILNPLEDLLGNAARNLSPPQLQKLQMVQRNALRLQRLVTTQLDFARVEAGRMDAVFQPTDLATYTEGLASNFRSLIEESGLKFNVLCNPTKEPVYVSRDMWEIIVFNLLSNAFKYTFSGKIEIKLRVIKKHVQLHVKDTGIGIANENVSKIFQRFERVEGVRARSAEGTGIGLALVKELVLFHGGTIKVKTAPGVGSTFIVTIPKGKSHLPARQILELDVTRSETLAPAYVAQASAWQRDDTTKKIKRQYLKSGANHSSKNKSTIIVVEDNRDMRDYLVSVISEEYTVIAVDGGERLLNIIEAGLNVDLIITDVMMPDMNGIELLKKIRETGADVPVMIISAKGDEQSRIEAMQHHASDYLAKPFSVNVLKGRIDLLLKRKKRAASFLTGP
jgi:PAS domain S-box-containing protein